MHFPSCAGPITWSLDPTGITAAGSTLERESALWTAIFDELTAATDYHFLRVPAEPAPLEQAPRETAPLEQGSAPPAHIRITYSTTAQPRTPGSRAALAHGGITGIDRRGEHWIASASEVTIDATGWRTWRHDPGMGQWLARHELGHALGLGHSSDASQVMAPRYQPRRSATSYQAEDLAGLAHLAALGCSGD